VARSRELPTAAVLMGGIVFLFMAGNWMIHSLMGIWSDLLSGIGQTFITDQDIFRLVMTLAWRFLLLVGPMILCLALMALVSNIAQFGLVISEEALTPKFSRLDPVSGFKRLFSLKSLVELVKSLAKIAIVGYVAWRAIQGEWEQILPLSGASPWMIGSRMAHVLIRIGVHTGIALLALALLDYLYQRWEHERSLKMTKVEVKDEYKQREGDPKVKAQIRKKQMQMAMRRMMAAVPKSDVVITNPQHLAVAIQYDKETMAAPTVVAKGAGFIAEKIRELASKHGVPILEDKPLAQALYRNVELGSQIPVSLYKAVAQILAHVYQRRAATG
jgi:flagellar biosynthetic protein FlhB